MNQPPVAPPPWSPRPPHPPDGTATRPPPIWPQLAPEAQRQLAQLVAELLRRPRRQERGEGGGHE